MIDEWWMSLRSALFKNEAPRRKRTGYQSGLKSDLYLGGHVVSPQTPLPRAYPTASGWGIQKIVIKLVWQPAFGQSIFKDIQISGQGLGLVKLAMGNQTAVVIEKGNQIPFSHLSITLTLGPCIFSSSVIIYLLFKA